MGEAFRKRMDSVKKRELIGLGKHKDGGGGGMKN